MKKIPNIEVTAEKIWIEKSFKAKYPHLSKAPLTHSEWRDVARIVVENKNLKRICRIAKMAHKALEQFLLKKTKKAEPPTTAEMIAFCEAYNCLGEMLAKLKRVKKRG